MWLISKDYLYWYRCLLVSAKPSVRWVTHLAPSAPTLQLQQMTSSWISSWKSRHESKIGTTLIYLSSILLNEQNQYRIYFLDQEFMIVPSWALFSAAGWDLKLAQAEPMDVPTKQQPSTKPSLWPVLKALCQGLGRGIFVQQAQLSLLLDIAVLIHGSGAYKSSIRGQYQPQGWLDSFARSPKTYDNKWMKYYQSSTDDRAVGISHILKMLQTWLIG